MFRSVFYAVLIVGLFIFAPWALAIWGIAFVIYKLSPEKPPKQPSPYRRTTDELT